MAEFQIFPIPLEIGTLALSQILGNSGDFDADISVLLQWKPDLVFSMTTDHEFNRFKATNLPAHLHTAGINWQHLPIEDFGAPTGETADYWPTASNLAKDVLNEGGKVLVHCRGGQGRSGMAAMRLMVELGYEPEAALKRIRAVRPGAVETDAQLAWARMQT